MKMRYVCEHCGGIFPAEVMNQVIWDRHIREKHKNEFSLEERHSDYRRVCGDCVKLPKETIFKI